MPEKVIPFQWHEPEPFRFPRHCQFMPPSRFAVPSEVPGLAARRIAADILDGVLHKQRTLDDQLDGAGAHPGLKSLADRDRALMRRLVATILRRLGTLGSRVVAPARSRRSDRRAARAERAPDRRRADSLDGCARSCRRRSFGAAGAVGPARREVCRTRQRRAAPLRSRGATADRRGQGADARHSAVAADALDRRLWRDHRAGDGDRHRPRTVARHHREVRRATMGDPPARRDITDRHRAHPAAGFGDDAARFQRRSMVGTGCRRRAAGAVVRRHQRQGHRRSLRRARRQDRATGASRRARHRGRSFAGAHGAAARQSRAAVAAGR